MFFPKADYRSFTGKKDIEIQEDLKRRYGKNSFCFPSSRREKAFLAWVSKIKEWESQKEVEVSYDSPEKKKYEDRENGNMINIFDFSTGILGKKKIKENFSFKSFEVELSADNWEVKDYEKNSPLYRRYTKSETRIGKTDDITRHAREITKERDSYFAKAKFIYNWVIENIAYKGEEERKGVIKVFREKSGNTEEISLLLVVLLRAVGIPARLVSGAWGEDGKRQTFHSWVEFYIEDVGWVPVDCVKKMFGELDNERVIFSKGENILLKNAPEHSDIFDIKYKRALYMQPDVFYVDSEEEGFFVTRKSKYLLIKDPGKW